MHTFDTLHPFKIRDVLLVTQYYNIHCHGYNYIAWEDNIYIKYLYIADVSLYYPREYIAIYADIQGILVYTAR